MRVELTEYHGGSITVNFDHVETFRANVSGGTEIKLKDAKVLHVTESYAIVQAKLKKA